MRFHKVPFLAVVGALASARAGASPAHYSYVSRPDAPVYFGHIAYCDLRGDERDPRVLHEGRADADPAVPNTPLLPGDTILTGNERRCEAQFDTGTVVRLDGATRLRIETILAPALSRDAGVTNFLLAKGRIEVRYRHHESSEVFQVLTPTAAVKLRDRALVVIGLEEDGSTGVDTRSGSAQVLFDRAKGKTRQAKVKAGQRFVFGPSGARRETETAAVIDFRAWSEIRDSAIPTQTAAGGRSDSPDLDDLPPVVADFASRSGDWGSWISSDVYGSVWRPRDNDRAGWRPYLEGQWAPLQGDLFWVADEPWGWVPYHLGYWTRLQRHGWVWVPGSWFAPAWVRWAPGPFLASWRPLDVWDFYGDDLGYPWYGGYGYGSDGGGATTAPLPKPPEHAVPRRPAPPAPTGTPFPPERPRPREIQRAMERVRDASRASLASLKDEADLVRRSMVAGSSGTPDPARRAEVKPRPSAPSPETAVPLKAAEAQAADAGVRYEALYPDSALIDYSRARLRDWNPDAPLARAMGGQIHYSSRDNAVHCVSCPAPLPRIGVETTGTGASATQTGSGGGGSASSSATATSHAAAPAAARPLSARTGVGGAAPCAKTTEPVAATWRLDPRILSSSPSYRKMPAPSCAPTAYAATTAPDDWKTRSPWRRKVRCRWAAAPGSSRRQEPCPPSSTCRP